MDNLKISLPSPPINLSFPNPPNKISSPNPPLRLFLALLPIILGYRDSDVDRAVKKQINKGVIFSMSHPIEIELAEKLKNLATHLKNLGHKIDHLDVGGGLAIDYQLEKKYDPAQLVKDLKSSKDILLKDLVSKANLIHGKRYSVKNDFEKLLNQNYLNIN